jgi:NAD(P)-dependent dehydrogenase (short-subunit alcohol dehydrogenase family)
MHLIWHDALKHVANARQSGDMADAVLFLVSDEDSWITGAVLAVGGGASDGPR